MTKYPYFIYPLLQQPPSEERDLLIAANVGDRDALIALIGNPEADLRNFYPDRTALSTEDTIDSFIARFGGGSSVSNPLLNSIPEPKPEPEPEPEPVPESQPEPMPQPQPEPEPIPEPEPVLQRQPIPEPEPEPEPSDPLEKVKFLVKKREYARALEIMEAIYLNNPKKSIYFADQIRYIRKLMLNESKKST